MDKYSILIPTYNEKKNISILIKKIYKKLKNCTYEIIVIDDNSTDGTNLILKKIRNKKKNFFYFIRKKNKKDLVQSVILGIKKSQFKNIIVMDGDLQHNPKYLPVIIKIFSHQKKDFLVCVRDFNKKLGLSFFRYYASLVLIFLVNILLGKKLKDPMSGFFIFKKKIFFQIHQKLYGKGFKLLLDLIYSTSKNFTIYEFKIIFNKRKNNISKMNLIVLYHILVSIFYKILIRLFR